MGKWLLALLLVLAAAAGAAYYWLFRPQAQALETCRQESTTIVRQTAELRNRVADLQTIRDQLEKSSTDLKQQVQEKEKELAGLHSTQAELLGQLKQEVADRQVQIEQIKDQLRVEMVDEVLFDSGEAVLKPAGVNVLRKVGGVLKKVENRRIEVQGHTDNVPIVGALTKRFPTNWELSAARATNVARFLQDETQVDPLLLSAAAYSQYRPRDSNDSDEGRRKNRRIEILLGPPLSPAAATN
jgi:chemotaxis protein MotB